MKAMWVLVAVGASACVQSSSIECASGRLCPESTVCDDTRDLCITPAQTTACNQLVAGAVCDAEGTPGICDRGLCEPGCGDGHVDPDEECDDGNFASHDGCSSACKVEIPSWQLQPKGWTGTYQHTAAYSTALGRLVVVGGQTPDGPSARIWQRDPSKASEPSAGWREVTSAFGTQLPPPRSGATMTYDSARGVIVLFGGADPALNLLADTWEYGAPFATTADGETIGTWKQITTATAPMPRYQGVMAYDEAIGKTVLCGGFGYTNPPQLYDTWTYDGSGWTELSPATTPSAPFRGAMAFDHARQLLVLFDATGTTYEFNGTDWNAPALTTKPTKRQFAAMTWDPTSGKLVMFGGRKVGLSDVSDTWTYDGTWQQLTPFASPSVREAATLTADPVNLELVLVGGSSFGGDVLRDMWELSAGVWLEHTPQFEPPATSSSAGVYRPLDHSLYVYGGFSRLGTGFLPELWRFDGERWTKHADGPFGRSDHVIGYDPNSDRLVVFGGLCSGIGSDCQSDFADTTFTYDPVTDVWTTSSATPPAGLARADAAMVYDEADRDFVMFGGATDASSAQSDTWIYSGGVWTLQLAEGSGPAGTQQAAIGWDPVRAAVTVFDSAGATWQYQHGAWSELVAASAAAPVGRSNASFDYDVQRKRFLLLGGLDAVGNHLTDVWELDPAAATWTQLFVPGSTPLPRHHDVFGPVSNAREHLLYGGDAGAQQPLGDVWLFQYRSSTPDEICNDGIDNDGDQQVDTADPDCAAL